MANANVKLDQNAFEGKDAVIGLHYLTTAILIFDEGGVLEANLSAQSLLGLSFSGLKNYMQGAGVPFLDQVYNLIEKGGFDRAYDVSEVNGKAVAFLVSKHKGLFICEIYASIPEREDIVADVKWAAHMLGHELRTPLSSIKGIAQLLETDLEPEKRLAFLNMLKGEADRIEALSRSFDILSGVGKADMQFINIHEVLESAINGAGPGSLVELVYDPSLPHVYGDENLLLIAATNLIKNALQASDKKQKIKIVTRFDPQRNLNGKRYPIILEIIDFGQGISPDILNKIFDPFFTTKPKGQGIGLALVKQIINEHKANITVQSTPGQTVFALSFPYMKENDA